MLAILLVCLGEGKEALRYGRDALRLNPGAPEFYLIAVAEAHILLKQFGDALPYIQRIEARRPQWLMALALSVICSMALAKPEAASATVGKILALSPRFTTEKWRTRIFYPDRCDVPTLCGLLASAGLPE